MYTGLGSKKRLDQVNQRGLASLKPGDPSFFFSREFIGGTGCRAPIDDVDGPRYPPPKSEGARSRIPDMVGNVLLMGCASYYRTW